MARRQRTPAERNLVAALDRYSLRHTQGLTTIGKNRLHTLRHYPLDASLAELLKLQDAKLIRVSLSCR